MQKPIFIIQFIFFSTLFVFSQQEAKYELHIGYGFYETFHAGMNYIFPGSKQKAGISLGFDNFIFKGESNYTVTAEYDLAVFRKKARNDKLYKWFLAGKVVNWYMEDAWYKWEVISACPSLQRIFYFSDKLFLSVDVGPIGNLVLYGKRKTFREVGWPYHVMPDARILLSYRF